MFSLVNVIISSWMPNCFEFFFYFVFYSSVKKEKSIINGSHAFIFQTLLSLTFFVCIFQELFEKHSNFTVKIQPSQKRANLHSCLVLSKYSFLSQNFCQNVFIIIERTKPARANQFYYKTRTPNHNAQNQIKTFNDCSMEFPEFKNLSLSKKKYHSTTSRLLHCLLSNRCKKHYYSI